MPTLQSFIFEGRIYESQSAPMRDKVKGMHVSKQQKEKASLGVGYFLRRFLANLAKPAILHFHWEDL